MMLNELRPTGITAISALHAMAGVCVILFGAPFIGLLILRVGMANGVLDALFLGIPGVITVWSPETYGVLDAALAGIGISSIIVAYGLLKGMPWAWRLAVICSVAGIAIGMAGAIAVTTLLDETIMYRLYGPVAGTAVAANTLAAGVLILAYLHHPRIRAHFRRNP